MIFLKPKEVEIDTEDGVKTFVLSRIPAVQAREIITQYPLTALPRVGEYKSNEAMMYKLMAYVQVKTETGTLIPLSTMEIINNHCPTWEVLAKLEMGMIEYNTTFFQNGRSSSFLEAIAPKVRALISQMLKESSAPSSGNQGTPPSMS